MTTVTKRRERKKTEIRTRILSTAIELFSRHGLDAVTIDQIAAAADIGKGTVYNYFAAKEDIVVAFMADLEGRLAPRVARFRPDRHPLDRVLADYILLHFRLKQRYHAFVRVFLAQMFLATDRLFPYMVAMQQSIDPPLEALFTTLDEHGLLRGGLDRAQLIHSFKTIHLGLTALWAVEGPPFRQTTRSVREQMRLFAAGIARKTS